MFTRYGIFVRAHYVFYYYLLIEFGVVSATFLMDVNMFVLMYWYRRRRKRQVISRRYWEHPIVRERYNLGTFRNLMCQLRRDEIKFFNYFRMSPSTFDDLLNRLKRDLTLQDTNMRRCISAEEKLVICLR